VAERLGVSDRTVWREIAARRLGFIRIRGCVVVPEEEIQRYLAERFTPPSVNPRKNVSQAAARIVAAVRRSGEKGGST
jgi:excisionase family DNA binding protein